MDFVPIITTVIIGFVIVTLVGQLLGRSIE